MRLPRVLSTRSAVLVPKSGPCTWPTEELRGRLGAFLISLQNTGVATWTRLAENRGRVRGTSVGSTTVVFDVMHGGHPDYTAPGIPSRSHNRSDLHPGDHMYSNRR